jgi:hypothetical protein
LTTNVSALAGMDVPAGLEFSEMKYIAVDW